MLRWVKHLFSPIVEVFPTRYVLCSHCGVPAGIPGFPRIRRAGNRNNRSYFHEYGQCPPPELAYLARSAYGIGRRHHWIKKPFRWIKSHFRSLNAD